MTAPTDLVRRRLRDETEQARRIAGMVLDRPCEDVERNEPVALARLLLRECGRSDEAADRIERLEEALREAKQYINDADARNDDMESHRIIGAIDAALVGSSSPVPSAREAPKHSWAHHVTQEEKDTCEVCEQQRKRDEVLAREAAAASACVKALVKVWRWLPWEGESPDPEQVANDILHALSLARAVGITTEE